MEHELTGLPGPGGRRRPVAPGPFALPAAALALLPVRPAWLWAALIAAAAALPWALGVVHRRGRSRWRLSAAGLERLGPDPVRYERSRIDALAVTTADGALTVLHRFGRTTVGTLTALGLEPLALFVTARRLGIRVHVLDGDAADLTDPALEDAAPEGDEVPLPRDHAAERRLLDQEAELLAAAHEPPPAAPDGAREPRELSSPAPVPSRHRVALLSALTGLLGAAMIARIALDGAPDFGARLAAACWTLIAITGVLAGRRRLLLSRRIRWTVSPEGLRVRARRVRELAAGDVAALVVGPGLRPDPVTGEPRRTDLAVLAFDHRLGLAARLPAHGLDAFQLAHALDDAGYRVVTPGVRPPHTPEYGLEGLPEIFGQVPGGRLVVAEGGLGWADAAGEIVLRMPADRIGGIELLTIGGHAWVRLYDSDGDEFFAAPLSALRVSRTDLRESARRTGLPVNDAEYDAYLSAAFHSAVSALSVPQPGGPSAPVAAPGVLLDATRRSRIATYVLSVVLCEVVALLGSVWLGPHLGGFAATASWALPAGVAIGLGGYWLYDRNRAQLKVSAAGLAVVTKRGRVEWDLTHDRVGGVGIDDSADRTPRLVVWAPSGRVVRHVGFPPDLEELRRACERYGLPWGPPDADRPAPPPPEL
ncbi:hypothetical protein [Actinomadura parmotrematis]|uniref:PH domain-containing protein n=1 Tax=Actinomadura parmotrematis TaxID=2864039 RepID=A0ABS7FZ53_9ACTN|nr:hypothetical protein [Actinomadura parmotrematis]MBW8485722.1 hypothetical protein [Actinomadura parmotrematis]